MHHEIIDIVIETSAGRVPVVAGTGSNSTRETITLTGHAEEAGADALELNVYFVPTDPDLTGKDVEKRVIELVSEVGGSMDEAGEE